ncbi:MAG: carbohydrate binding family 9 domain-containing protein [Calditrichaeota bacterium]|nr:carbohydrate binding family 9 domain-containing protein [Calditrichota bacterium]
MRFKLLFKKQNVTVPFRVILIGITALLLNVNFSIAGSANVSEKELSSQKLLPVKKISGKIHIDGRLDENFWQQAKFSDEFQQQEPGDGDPPSERTEIAALYNGDYLYFGIKCFDSEPDKIIRTELRRDKRMDNDDYFEILLDTYHDKRSGFYFIFNPYGTKRDAKLDDEGRNYNPEWDGIWECKAKISNEGWFAEVAIPWKTLRFVEGQEIYFGANFGRMIRRKNEKLDWNHIPREVGTWSIFKLTYAGHLGPFQGLRQGGNLEFQPFLIGGLQNDQETDFNFVKDADMGVDAKVNITSNLVADLTFNTDFAQVEADQERVNLTRFSLYFPEKRDFFLEGAEIFNTSGGSRFFRGHGGGGTPQVFYSRRIGISDGRQIPLWGGAKITGKIGRTTIGVLNMQTRTKKYTSDDEQVTVPSTNFGVLRVKRDLFTRSSVGVLLTSKIEKNNSRNNQAFAIDSRMGFSPTISLTTLLAGSNTSDETNQKNKMANADFNWRTDLYGASMNYLDIQENFNPEMGFVRRTDIRKTFANLFYSPRSKRFQSVRKFSYSVSGSYLTDQQNYLLERNLSLNYRVFFENSARFMMRLAREYEYLSYDWEVRENIEIKEGIYQGYAFWATFRSNEAKPLNVSVSSTISQYYGGTRYSLNGGINWTGIPKFTVNSDYNFNQVELPNATFHTFTVSNRLIYAFSTEAYLKAYIQYNSDRLRFDDRVKWNVNILFRYIFRPGSDFYIVYNQEQLVGTDNDELTNRTLMAKVVYFWRK